MRVAVALGCMVLAGCGDNLRLPLAWGVGVTTFDAIELGLVTAAPPDPFADAIVPSRRLAIPTYDGSGQAVHPDVLREPDRLVLAITPYPYSDDLFENPSVLVSASGMQFTEPRAGLNPLVEAPPIDHNDDPDLHVDPVTGEYELLYLETLRPDTQHLISLRSRDLETWSRTLAIDYDLAAGAPFVVSPAALVHGGTTSLFDVRIVGDGTQIERLDSPDGRTWDPATARPIAIDTGAVIPWHLDALATPAGYALLINGYTAEFGQQDLYLATSSDLVTWTFRPAPLLAHDDPALDVATVYRSTAVVAGDRLVVWYSHQYRE